MNIFTITSVLSGVLSCSFALSENVFFICSGQSSCRFGSAVADLLLTVVNRAFISCELCMLWRELWLSSKTQQTFLWDFHGMWVKWWNDLNAHTDILAVVHQSGSQCDQAHFSPIRHSWKDLDFWFLLELFYNFIFDADHSSIWDRDKMVTPSDLQH